MNTDYLHGEFYSPLALVFVILPISHYSLGTVLVFRVYFHTAVKGINKIIVT